MTIEDIFDAYEQEFSFEKQCKRKPYDFSSLRWGWKPGLYEFFKGMIMTDEVKKMLSDARLVLDLDFDKEMSFGVVKMSLVMHQTHPLATRAIRVGKATHVFNMFKVTRKKRPDGGWAWTTCKRYFDDKDTEMSIEDCIASYIKIYKSFVLDKIEESLEDLVDYDRMATYAENGWPLVMTTEQIKHVVRLVRGMAYNGSGILSDYVNYQDHYVNILDDPAARKKLLDRLESYRDFKESLWPSK